VLCGDEDEAVSSLAYRTTMAAELSSMLSIEVLVDANEATIKKYS
jgi:hypothetical protein